MEAARSSMSLNDEDRALKCLLDAFGSTFSLREIAFAYRQAGKNSNLAGEILFTMHDGSSSCFTEEEMVSDSLESSNGKTSENSYHVVGSSKVLKQKRYPAASMGTVSGVIGKGYTRPPPLATRDSIKTKPLKLDSKEFPEEEIWDDGSNTSSSANIGVNKDMEDFLFKILGDGFNMNRAVIQEVLARCGYDMPKSMDRLLDLSVGTSRKRNGYHSQPPIKLTDTCSKPEPSSCPNKLLSVDSSVSNGNGGSIKNVIENPRELKGKIDLQKEVLAALFDGNAKFEEPPRRASVRRAVKKRSNALGEIVSEPETDSTTEYQIDLVYKREDIKDDEDGEYQVARRAVKEHRSTMKEYYKGAVNAFAEGDHDRAGNLLEKGNFFLQQARAAEEKSAHIIFETREVDEQEIMSLDLYDGSAREAIRLLKLHLSSFSGIPSFMYLKVNMEKNEEDNRKGTRKKHILKLLEKESIEWIEEGTPGTILICLENINPKSLSFASKPSTS